MFLYHPFLYWDCSYRYCVSVVSCFDRSLRNKRDAGFYIFGQLARFIHKLCVRCLVDRCIPSDDDWTGLLGLHLEGQEALLADDFLHRLNLTSKLDQSLKIKAVSDLSDKKLDHARVDSLRSSMRTEFCDLARHYYLFLIEGVRKHVTMTTNNVRGMASFDPHVMYEMPLDFATKCFAELYRGFRLRGWVQDAGEQTCRDEYIAVLTHLRGSRVSLTSTPTALHDLVDFLSKLPALRERKHVFHLFKLSCLCLTDMSPNLPLVTFGNVSTANPSCRSTDVILPVQSLLANLPQSVPVCTTDKALEEFSKLCMDFIEDGLDASYDPWRSVHLFGRSKIHKRLSSSYKQLLSRKSRPKKSSGRPEGGVASTLAPLRGSQRVRPGTCFGSLSKSLVAQSAASLLKSPGK